MKIAYFLYWLDGPESGVIKKIAGQTSAWIKMGHEVHVFISTLNNSRLAIEENQIPLLLSAPYSLFKHSSFYTWFIESNRIYKEIRKFSPDLMYLRNCKYTYGIARALKAFPSVMELNGNELLELKKTSPGFIYTWLFWAWMLKPVDAFISVSHEIIQQSSFIKYRKPNKVIGNGIDQSKYVVLPLDHTKPNVDLVFIGSARQAWHGVEEILRFSKKKEQWNFHIIGNEIDEFIHSHSQYKNVKFYGKLAAHDYLKVFETCDVAVGTMALHKKKMNETSALKIIEYLSCGLPVIIGYKDTNFPGKTSFICELPNCENNMVDNINTIDDFVKSWKGKRVDRELVKNLDTSVKEKERLDFFDTIIATSPKKRA